MWVIHETLELSDKIKLTNLIVHRIKMYRILVFQRSRSTVAFTDEDTDENYE